MGRIVGFLAVAYACLLTWFLVSPDPFAIFGPAARSTQALAERSLTGAMQHAGGYAVFTGLWILATRSRRSRLTVVVLAVLHGAATELLQHIVPQRECNAFDMLANVGGIMAGGALAWFAARLSARRSTGPGNATPSGKASLGASAKSNEAASR